MVDPIMGNVAGSEDDGLETWNSSQRHMQLGSVDAAGSAAQDSRNISYLCHMCHAYETTETRGCVVRAARHLLCCPRLCLALGGEHAGVFYWARSHQPVAFCFRIIATYEVGELPERVDDERRRAPLRMELP